jgi:DNA-binding NarL/FixJ family response regulator
VIRLYIVAASSLARSGLENLVAGRGVSIIGSTNGLEALASQVLDAEPDAVLLDASGGQPEPILQDLVASNLACETTVLVLLDNAPSGFLAEALRAGVRAVLPTQITREQLLAALNAAIAGLVITHPSGFPALLPEASFASSSVAELTEPLTPRERQVLQMLASGLVNKEIAAKLGISEHTVKFHVASILGKLGASTRTEAVSLGIRHGVVLL